MELKDFDVNDLIKQVEHTIHNTIPNQIAIFNDWFNFDVIEDMQGGEHEWLIEVVKAIIENFQAFNTYKQFVGTEHMKQSLELMAKRGPTAESIELMVRGFDETTNMRVKALMHGGEMELKDGEKITVDKNTALNEQEIKNASNQLRDYFIKKYERDLEKRLK